MRGEVVAWHDLECGSYEADLGLWRELASERPGGVLEVGAGTGRVALDLAVRGHEVLALDSDPELVRELGRRARERRLAVECVTADVRALSLPRRFPLAIAPMQVFQLLGGAEERGTALRRLREHLEPGGLAAIALADPFDGLPADRALPPLPDLREHAGWVLSSTPVAVRSEDGAVAVDRVRQSVSPDGELSEEMATIRLDTVGPERLTQEAVAAGLHPLPSRRVPDTRDHVGSTVVLLEAP
jgi:SAM-dependent methyltransferase